MNDVKERARTAILAAREDLLRLSTRIHATPELAFEEREASSAVAEREAPVHGHPRPRRSRDCRPSDVGERVAVLAIAARVLASQPADVAMLSDSRRMRAVFLVAGVASLVVGLLFFLVPGPGAPFIILAASCFARSSPRAHRWLLSNRWLGPIVRRRGARP